MDTEKKYEMEKREVGKSEAEKESLEQQKAKT